jgi:hypothetical protein
MDGNVSRGLCRTSKSRCRIWLQKRQSSRSVVPFGRIPTILSTNERAATAFDLSNRERPLPDRIETVLSFGEVGYKQVFEQREQWVRASPSRDGRWLYGGGEKCISVWIQLTGTAER